MKSKQAPQVQTAFRVPPEFLQRLDAAALKLSTSGMRVTRTDVLRMASSRGLKDIEAELKKPSRAR